jgi:hypothetical protein
MSEHGAEAMRGVAWPSNGLAEVPFRVYTDPEQYGVSDKSITTRPPHATIEPLPSVTTNTRRHTLV